MIAVQAEGICKGYRQYARPADSLKELLLRRPFHSMLWALRELSFDVPRGHRLGVVGANGAGKSTLLKLLAGTLAPTSGRLTVNGRVSAILELGSGFHPEFTGLDNVRMGCAMQGLSPRETEARIPEILAFSELGEAVARPVKTYSSGMYVRLAFSVVTAVDPDILVIDEALSVGDQHFQKKSLDRIREFMALGRTLIFCSHNLYHVKSLCNRVLWLEGGHPRLLGPAEEVVDAYLDASRRPSEEKKAKPEEAAVAAELAEILDVDLVGGDEASRFENRSRLEVRVRVRSATLGPGELTLAVVIMRNDDLHVYGTSTEIEGVPLRETGPGEFAKSLVFDELELLSGHYLLYIYLLDAGGIHIYDKREGVSPFVVRHGTREVGVSRLAHRWVDP